MSSATCPCCGSKLVDVQLANDIFPDVEVFACGTKRWENGGLRRECEVVPTEGEKDE